MLPIPPFIVKLLAQTLALLGLIGYAYYRGHEVGALSANQHLITYQQEVQHAIQVQTANTQALVAARNVVTQQTADSYQTQLSTLQSSYAWLSKHPTYRGSSVPAATSTTRGPDAAPADPVPDSVAEIKIPDDELQLEQDCAVTTLQLVTLQHWFTSLPR